MQEYEPVKDKYQLYKNYQENLLSADKALEDGRIDKDGWMRVRRAFDLAYKDLDEKGIEIIPDVAEVMKYHYE